jgi:hypothetical protein
MNPQIIIVLGLAFEFKDHIVERMVTKYHEDTGKPYQKKLRERQQNIPEWLEKAIADKRENCDDWHAIGGISVYWDQCTGVSCMVGKLLMIEDPRQMGNEAFVIEDPTSADRIDVIKWLHEAGAPPGEFTMDDIKIRVGTEWM